MVGSCGVPASSLPSSPLQAGFSQMLPARGAVFWKGILGKRAGPTFKCELGSQEETGNPGWKSEPEGLGHIRIAWGSF